MPTIGISLIVLASLPCEQAFFFVNLVTTEDKRTVRIQMIMELLNKKRDEWRNVEGSGGIGGEVT